MIFKFVLKCVWNVFCFRIWAAFSFRRASGTSSLGRRTKLCPHRFLNRANHFRCLRGEPCNSADKWRRTSSGAPAEMKSKAWLQIFSLEGATPFSWLCTLIQLKRRCSMTYLWAQSKSSNSICFNGSCTKATGPEMGACRKACSTSSVRFCQLLNPWLARRVSQSFCRSGSAVHCYARGMPCQDVNCKTPRMVCRVVFTTHTCSQTSRARSCSPSLLFGKVPDLPRNIFQLLGKRHCKNSRPLSLAKNKLSPTLMFLLWRNFFGYKSV